MQIAIQAHGFSLTDTLEKHVEDRIRFTFSHVSGRVRRILVILSDINGPRGGIDKRCLVEYGMTGYPVWLFRMYRQTCTWPLIAPPGVLNVA